MIRGRPAAALVAAWAAVALAGAPGAAGPPPDGVTEARPQRPGEPAFAWSLPPGFPEPLVPEDNPMSAAKVALGIALFHDTRLSASDTTSCATCHRPERAFTDGRPRPVGDAGDALPFNTLPLANVAYEASLTWSDPSVRTLEEQVRRPLLADGPVEMGLAGRERAALDRLRGDAEVAALFREAFPAEPEAVTVDNVVNALSCYLRTLVSGRSPYDRLVFDDDQAALSPASRRGMRLFFSERAGCARCHGGLNFSGPVVHVRRPHAEPVHHAVDESRVSAGGPRAVKAPSLRNVALTGPYMHDGSVDDLEEAVRHAARAGAPLTPEEVGDLLAFLTDLTDGALAAPTPAGTP